MKRNLQIAFAALIVAFLAGCAGYYPAGGAYGGEGYGVGPGYGMGGFGGGDGDGDGGGD